VLSVGLGVLPFVGDRDGAARGRRQQCGIDCPCGNQGKWTPRAGEAGDRIAATPLAAGPLAAVQLATADSVLPPSCAAFSGDHGGGGTVSVLSLLAQRMIRPPAAAGAPFRSWRRRRRGLVWPGGRRPVAQRRQHELSPPPSSTQRPANEETPYRNRTAIKPRSVMLAQGPWAEVQTAIKPQSAGL